MGKIRAGVLGATGMVGQNYVRLLESHPWFELSYVAASPNSAGKKYSEAVKGRWHMESGVPEAAGGLIVEDANLAEKALGKCDFVFSALEMDKKLIAGLEEKYASIGLPVVSNASAHRHTPDVPMLIPEINSRHLEILPLQQKSRGWKKGFIVVKPNCSLQSYITPMHALREAGFAIEKAIIATMQAVSGAGFPGVSSFDIIDNVVPFIGGEEEKSELDKLENSD